MFKVIFVLILSNWRGGFDSNLTFVTEQQCLAAKSAIKKEWNVAAICIEKQVPVKKMKCKIQNATDYMNPMYNKGYPNATNLTAYPYPIGFECMEDN